MTEEELQRDRRYSSRKWRFALLVWGAGTLGWIFATPIGWWAFPTDNWVLFSQWVLGLYMAGNVGDTFGEATKKMAVIPSK